MSNQPTGLIPIARFCGQCTCGCPELAIASDADESCRIVISDDFGSRIQMSEDQFWALVEEVRTESFKRTFTDSLRAVR